MVVYVRVEELLIAEALLHDSEHLGGYNKLMVNSEHMQKILTAIHGQLAEKQKAAISDDAVVLEHDNILRKVLQWRHAPNVNVTDFVESLKKFQVHITNGLT